VADWLMMVGRELAMCDVIFELFLSAMMPMVMWRCFALCCLRLRAVLSSKERIN
jgi:hypothetical protein